MRTKARTIERPRLDEDVVPFTKYRRTLNDCFARTSRTHRPIVITQNGHSTSVMMSVVDFERTWDEIETWRKRAAFSRMIEVARNELKKGEVIEEDKLFDSLEEEIESGFTS